MVADSENAYAPDDMMMMMMMMT